MQKYVKPAYIRKQFDITNATLRKWADTGKVKSIVISDNGNRLFEYNDFLRICATYNRQQDHYNDP